MISPVALTFQLLNVALIVFFVWVVVQVVVSVRSMAASLREIAAKLDRYPPQQTEIQHLG